MLVKTPWNPEVWSEAGKKNTNFYIKYPYKGGGKKVSWHIYKNILLSFPKLAKCVVKLTVSTQNLAPIFKEMLCQKSVLCSDVNPDLVGSGFIWVRGSGSRGIKSLIKWREKLSLTNKNLSFSQEIIFLKSEPTKSRCFTWLLKIKRCFENLVILLTRIRIDQTLWIRIHITYFIYGAFFNIWHHTPKSAP